MNQAGKDSMSYKDPKPSEIDVYATAWVLEKPEKTYCYKKAFPRSKAKPKTLNEFASRFHAHGKVRARIDQLQALSAKQTEEEFCISISDIKKTLTQVIKVGFNKTHELEKPDLSAVNGAIDKLCKIDGYYAAEKRTLNTDPDYPLELKYTVEFMDAEDNKK